MKSRANSLGHEFWVDVGGTFTDCFMRTPSGILKSHKLLSTGRYRGRVLSGDLGTELHFEGRHQDPPNFFQGFSVDVFRGSQKEHSGLKVKGSDPVRGVITLEKPVSKALQAGCLYELYCDLEAPVVGIRWLMGVPLHKAIPKNLRLYLGTTRATNALLERKGVPTALITTRGFRDVLAIGYQNRPKLFELNIQKSRPPYETVVEVDERVGANGEVLVSPDRAIVKRSLGVLLEKKISSLCICFLNAYRNGEHEKQVAQWAGELGFSQVSVSSELSPEQGMILRGDTTTVDAYLSPIVRDYLGTIKRQLPEASIQLMTSSGGMVPAGASSKISGKDVILSGPAGGVVGAAWVGNDNGCKKVIGFDMGGTSTDVSRFDGAFERRYQWEFCEPGCDTGIRLLAPMLSVETVAAGGGSICDYDSSQLRVGPESAGAVPGPACYGLGGPLTVTDINLFLGRISKDSFDFALDVDSVEKRLDGLIQRIRQEEGKLYTREALAEGFLSVANLNMAAAIQKISVARGYDVREYTLLPFGGAAAQHACAIARVLEMDKVLLSPYGSLLSAFGMGVAPIQRFSVRNVGKILNPALKAQLPSLFVEMKMALLNAFKESETQGVIKSEYSLDLRYQGQNTSLTLPICEGEDPAEVFTRAHNDRYGFSYPSRSIEVRSARVSIQTSRSVDKMPSPAKVNETNYPHPLYEAGKWREVKRWPWGAFQKVKGPALVSGNHTTLVLEPGWTAEQKASGDLLLSYGAEKTKVSKRQSLDPTQLALFVSRFTAIAEEMGETLQRTATSVNVKERLDFSCALFDEKGHLVVNAPHIPVHLGSMGEAVRAIRAQAAELQPGEVYITNDPFLGGSHLPDVTVVSAVFDAAGKKVVAYVGSRAHHAEIGGISPGSMPAFSKNLEEEGVCLSLLRYEPGQVESEEKLRRAFTEGRYPSRDVDSNVQDIQAQVAANGVGVRRLGQLVETFGAETVHLGMHGLQEAATRKMRQVLRQLPTGPRKFEDVLEDGSPIRVQIEVLPKAGEAIVDFSGTAGVHSGNLNANIGIVRAALLYCFRCLVEESIPLNDGVLQPIHLKVPRPSLLDPSGFTGKPPAVVGGNVETAQRIVDVIFGALGGVAASQGTMNNFLFGRAAKGGQASISYYETIAGGTGAGAHFFGADGVHSHMTNTRITDPEVLEERFPVRVREFSVRSGSGGKGRHPGGNGLSRELEFLEAMEVSLLTSRRGSNPYGVVGGRPGSCGKNEHFQKDKGEWFTLPAATQLEVKVGDRVRIKTPGGGGYGNPL